MGKAAAMNNDTTGIGNGEYYDQNEVKNRNLSSSQSLVSSGEDQSRVKDNDGNIRPGPGMEVLARDDLKIQPQQNPGPLVNWERFLPVKSIKVLLVESDDSTRHIVSALLRNCSYEVTAVAHGLQAWKTLQDVSSRIDLVLTEVVMPLLSGMDLLCKIMGHKTLKNIPVIMMSAHDSMGIVFKCLSKGAVDFLAKPIRKNELKNLWQHVWRRSYSLSGSGSGSESGTQAEKPANLRITNDSESNTGNSDENGNGSNGLSIQNCSGDGSGTETSWTKKAAEIKHASPWDQRPESDAPDSICAEVIYVGPEKHYKMDDEHLDKATGKDVISENPSACKGMKVEDALSEVECKPEEEGQQDQEHVTCEKLRSEGFNVGGGGGAANCSIPQPQSRDYNGVGTKRKFDQGEAHYLELTLKRLHGMADNGNAAKDDHNILRHSDLSAFSKYNTVSSVNQGPLGNKGSSPLENGSDAVRSGAALSAQQSNGSTKNNQLGFKSSESSAFQPVQNGNQKASSKETEPPSKASNQKVQVQHHHHHHHHHHYHHHHQTPDLNQNISAPTAAAAAAAAPPCRSSNLANGMEENGGNVSGGGSNNGSDGNNNGSNNTPSGGDDTENGTAKTSGSGGFSGNTNSSVMDDVRVSLREAALTKFRQKRKERCFDKRVRYQSRKKLAEQRPRIKGQFVKQIKFEGKSGEERQSRGMKDSCDTDR